MTTYWWVELRLRVLEVGVYSLVGDPDSRASGSKFLQVTGAGASAMAILGHLVDRAGPEMEMGSSCLGATGLLVDGVCHCPSSCLALGIPELVPIDWRVGPCSGANELEGGFQNTPVYLW